jgi:hypothetical protein
MRGNTEGRQASFSSQTYLPSIPCRVDQSSNSIPHLMCILGNSNIKANSKASKYSSNNGARYVIETGAPLWQREDGREETKPTAIMIVGDARCGAYPHPTKDRS